MTRAAIVRPLHGESLVPADRSISEAPVRPSPEPAEPALVRGIGRWDLLALVLNAVIGAGIFGLPSTAFGLSGTYSLAAYVVCAGLVLLFALCFAEVGSRFSGTGGPYAYAREAFGRFAGFQIGWLLWVVRVTAFAALANLFVSYLGVFWPAATGGSTRVAVLCTVVALITAVNVVGVRPSAVFTNAFTIGKLSALAFFVVAGLFFISPENYATAARMPTYAQFSQTVLILAFAFTGFEMAVIPAGEIVSPSRHVPFALLTGIAIVAVLYVLIQFVAIGTLPSLAESSRPLADASERMLGPAGAAIVSLGALVSITGTLNSVSLVSGRLLFALAKDGHLPAAVGAVHAGFRTPHIAILLSSIAILAMTLAGSFAASAAISTVIRLLAYGATCAALLSFRRRGQAPFVAPLGVFAAIAALVLTVWLLTNSEAREAWMTAAAALLGTALYYVFTRGGHGRQPRGS